MAELQPVSSQGRRGEMPVVLPLIALAQGGPGPEVSQWGHQFPVWGGWIWVPPGSSEVSAMWGSPLSLEASDF